MGFSRVVAVIGYKDSGKTAVVEGLVRELVKRGYSVGTVKHVGIPGFTIDQEGRDTWRHARAGAERVICVADGEISAIERKKVKWEEIKQRLRDLDFFVLEGFKEVRGIAKVVVAKNKMEAEELLDRYVIGCVGAELEGLPSFSFDSMAELADLVEERAFPPPPGLDCGKCGFRKCDELAQAIAKGERKWDSCVVLKKEKTVLIVDGIRIPLNPFVQDLIANMVSALVSSLREARGKRVLIEVHQDAR